MAETITTVRDHLTGMLHGGTLNKVRNPYHVMNRAANNMLSRIDPMTTMRTQALSRVVHDDVYNYALPSDFKKIVDLIPQDSRTHLEDSARLYAGRFDLQKELRDKTISIESDNGTKHIRINWRSRSPKTLHDMNSVTANGTWSAVGSAANIVADDLYKVSGSASIRFDLVVTGDGIQNTTMSAVDLSDWDEQADFFVWCYFGTAPTSVTGIWGNDLTTNYWTGVAQTTQADGTAFKVGWNLIRIPWTTATETGTVAPATIDAFKLTVAAGAAISDIRVDNIMVSLGRPFDIKYFSSYIFKNSAGTWINQPTADTDSVVADGMELNIFLFECLKAAAQQMEAEEGAFDLNYATKALHGDPAGTTVEDQLGLYRLYAREYPAQTKRAVTTWSSGPRYRR